MKIKKQLLLVFLMLVSLSAAADIVREKKVMGFEKISFSLQRGITKSVVQGVHKRIQSNDPWGIINVVYKSEPEWADEIEMRFYVLFYNKEKKVKKISERFTLLNDKITYLNVPYGSLNKGEIFIHPNSLKRYGEVKEIYVELWYNDTMQDTIEKSFALKKEKKLITGIRKDIQPKTNELLNRFYTPFVFDGDNSSEMIKLF